MGGEPPPVPAAATTLVPPEKLCNREKALRHRDNNEPVGSSPRWLPGLTWSFSTGGGRYDRVRDAPPLIPRRQRGHAGWGRRRRTCRRRARPGRRTAARLHGLEEP